MSEELFHVPVMTTLDAAVLVKRPEREAEPPSISQYGGVSLGASYVPLLGACIHVALHCPDGTTLVATMPRPAIAEFATQMNGDVARISNGLVREESQQ